MVKLKKPKKRKLNKIEIFRNIISRAEGVEKKGLGLIDKEVEIAFTKFDKVKNKWKPYTTWATKETNELTDPLEFKKKYQENPDSGIAVKMESIPQIVVLDADIKNNKDGLTIYELLKGSYDLPDTYTIESISGGKHFYFWSDKGHLIRKWIDYYPGVDLIATGSVLNIPPTKGYKVIDDDPIAELPKGFTEIILKEQKEELSKESKKSKNWDDGADIGARDDTIFRRACSYRALGLTKKQAKKLILEFAEKCRPAFPEQEALKCLESAWKYSPNYELNDTGNGKRFAEFFRGTLKYVSEKEYGL